MAMCHAISGRFAGYLIVLAAVPSLAGVTAVGADPRPQHGPNVLLVMSDDQGYWDCSANGNPHIDTPQMARLAAEGIRLRRYYAAPVCSLTRAGMMTGRYSLRTGLYNTRFGGDSLGLDEITVAERLRQAGYRTGLFGKWHLGKYPGYQPQDRGFDQFMGHYHGHIERYQHPDQIVHNGRPVDARGYVTDLFTDAAIDFIEASVAGETSPFFCAVMYNTPHSPFLLDTSHADQPDGDSLITKYLERGLPLREARIYGMVERIDDNLGRLLKTLERLDIAEDTLVIFTGDNGGVSRYWKGGMNGFKSSPYEGGVRAPCFVRWPGRIEAGSETDSLTSHVDLLPTLCDVAGIPVPEDRVIDGKSWLPLWQAPATAGHHEYVYHTWDRYFPNPDRRWGISDGRWKLVGMFAADAAADPAKWRLFDLRDDPGETVNLAAERPADVWRLRGEFVRWFDKVTHGQTYAPIRIPVGVPRGRGVVIEPSWSDRAGKQIEYRFDGYDWDTLEGWREPGESARWRLDVHAGGTYRVRLRYGCRPLDAGGTLLIAATNDPTVSGDPDASADATAPDAARSERPGSRLTHPVQATSTADQFAWFEAGRLELKPGAMTLRAEVVSAPGRELMRLAAIELVGPLPDDSPAESPGGRPLRTNSRK